MNQENGMPLKFQAFPKKKKRKYDVKAIHWDYGGMVECFGRFMNFRRENVDLPQAIGATSSDDPPQELYLGDVVRIKLEKNNITAVIVWHNLSVCLKFREEGKIVYYGLGDFFRSGVGKIKKLGSRYTKEGEEILKKAGLEEKR